jgi:4-amino-4-deoxy-L-arabinose transferase-like glycosyltransferase
MNNNNAVTALLQRLNTFRERHPRIVLTLLTLALLLPFAGKAFHIDDPLFVWAGHHMRTHPFDPYGFEVNWYGSAMHMVDVTKNPPFACVYIALLSSIFGEREFWLHVGFLAQAIAAILGTYSLAQRFCQQPFFVAFAALLTPVFLVSSTTLMCDTLMLAFWIWAMVWWLRALETNELVSFILAGLLLGACALTKYFGIALLPLLFFYSLFKTRGLGLWLVYLLIPVAILALYQCWVLSFYGKGLLFDAATYAIGIRSHEIAPFAVELLTVLAFTGGCFVIILMFVPLLWRPKVWVPWGVAVLLFLLLTRSSLPFAVYLQLVVLASVGAAVVALTLLDLTQQRDTNSVLLLLWISGTLFFCFLNWTVNGRSLLPIVPAVALVLWRQIERSRWLKESRSRSIYLPIAFGAAASISLVVAQADYQLANTARTAAAEIRRKLNSFPPSAIWFQGHWGFQYYAQVQGMAPLDRKNSQIKRGDLVVIPLSNTNVVPVPSYGIEPVEVIREIPCRWLSTMNATLGAGFYSSVWGPLPFAFGPVPPEEYQIVRFREVPREGQP